MLGKTPSSTESESLNLESAQAPSLAQPLVFSNSKQSAIAQPGSGNSFAHHSMVRERRALPGVLPRARLGDARCEALTPDGFLWAARILCSEYTKCAASLEIIGIVPPLLPLVDLQHVLLSCSEEETNWQSGVCEE